MSGPEVSERDAWLALAAVDGVGEGLLARFVGRFGSASGTLRVAADQDAGRAIRRLMDAAPGRLSVVVAGRVRMAALDPYAVARRVAELGAWVVTPLDPRYPPRLRHLDPPPAALYGLGRRSVVSDPRTVAVVGTRHPTPGGRALAARIARRLVEADATVISGLAIGIDGAAHAATIEAGGRTTAVIGGGLEHPGPRAHERLRQAILHGGGVVVSEHAPHVRPTRGTFPRRNRIISVLAMATIVVEAPIGSGALITARHALEQGRRLLVVPGRPGEPAAAGCLALLRETPARPLVGIDEMVVDLGLGRERPDGTTGRPVPLGLADALALLGPVERSVAGALHRGPATMDALIAATGLPAPVVAGTLTLLQLRGWCQPYGAMHLPAGPLLAEEPRRAGPGRSGEPAAPGPPYGGGAAPRRASLRG